MRTLGRARGKSGIKTLAHWLPTIELIIAMMSAARYVVSELKDACLTTANSER